MKRPRMYSSISGFREFAVRARVNVGFWVLSEIFFLYPSLDLSLLFVNHFLVFYVFLSVGKSTCNNLKNCVKTK